MSSTSLAGDDRLEHVVPFILQRLELAKSENQASDSPRPLLVGLNGIQGCGKSTLVDRLQHVLSQPPHSLNIVVFSIDDLYLPHEEQVRLASAHPNNPLVQHRGQPSTHDVDLCANILRSLRRSQRTEIPIYDKSAYRGQGDRDRDRSVVVDPSQRQVDLVILEGWFIGFRAISPEAVEERWRQARIQASSGSVYRGRLGQNELENVLFVNEQLRRYDSLTDQFDALVHVDAEDTHFAYDWRLEAEHRMIEQKGSGMTDAEVRAFVDGYYPSYELYTSALRSGAFPDDAGKQLRIVVDKGRKVVKVFRI